MDTLYTTHEVANMVGVDASTISKWIDKGILVAFRTPGGHRRVRQGDLRNFLQERKMPVPEEVGGGTFRMVAVDDEKPVLHALKRALRRQAPQVELFATTSSIDALLQVAQEKPHAMLIDLNMPDLDGLEVCRRIRARESFASVSVVLFTGHHTDKLVAESLNAGALACLPKPVEVSTLLEIFKLPLAFATKIN